MAELAVKRFEGSSPFASTKSLVTGLGCLAFKVSENPVRTITLGRFHDGQKSAGRTH